MRRAPLGGDEQRATRLVGAALVATLAGSAGACSLILDFDEKNDSTSFDASIADAGPVGDGGDPCAAYEPNESLATAFTITAGSYAPLGICPSGDHDFFGFTVDGASDVVIQALFTNSAGMDLEMRLYDSTGMVIDLSQGFEDNETIERSAAGGDLLAAGDYFIEIFGFNDSDTNSYTLELTIASP